jgi:peptidoglycan/xylan/chitin deacetylase (PgdA/CDA1 family)
MDAARRRHPKATKRLELIGLAVLGLATVSIPVTIAMVLAGTRTSDVLAIGGGQAVPRHHATPAGTVSRIRCVPQRGFYVLSFDDGPLTRTTARLVAAVRRARAVATFFDVGRLAAAHQDLVELQRRAGQVANHSYTHPHLPRVSSARRVQELRATADVLDHPNDFFRPPYGETSAATDADVRRSGLRPVYWTVDARDLRAPRALIVRRALRVRPGGIILLHDGVEATIAAVPAIVAGLRRRGLCPGRLAGARKSVISATGTSFHVMAARP